MVCLTGLAQQQKGYRPESRNGRSKAISQCAVVAIDEFVLAGDIIYDREVVMMKEVKNGRSSSSTNQQGLATEKEPIRPIIALAFNLFGYGSDNVEPCIALVMSKGVCKVHLVTLLPLP